ncbi:MAG TPA: lytic transglycosylase domain-containing protein [Micavibrio sp.]
MTMLACAGTGLAGALTPLPTRKADSAILAPLPTAKPERLASLAPAAGLLLEDMTAAAAADLAAIEPAAFTPQIQAGHIPVPLRKPDFDEPDVEMLLTFGLPPLPKAKPLTRSLDALSEQDAMTYRRIFAAQSAGDWEQADEDIRRLTDFRLRGHVLFQRYMHPSYKASFGELQAWMDLYSDLPGADRLYKLAVARKPASFDGIISNPRNQIGLGPGFLHNLSSGGSWSSEAKRSPAQKAGIALLTKDVNDNISQGAPTKAARLLSGSPAAKIMDAAEYDQLRARIASGYLLMGKSAEARALASASARRSGEKAPMAGWAGGLAAWRQSDYAAAAPLFEQTASSPYVSNWLRAAGAYWAARSHMRAGHNKEVTIWLTEAARYPRTFYGLLATRALGRDFNFNWKTPDFTKERFKLLAAIPSAWRAMALVQAGQNHLAEDELLQIDPGKDKVLQEALLAYTQKVNLPALAMRIANNYLAPDGGLYDAALYPMLPWEPAGGYRVDRALIHAIIRQESKFNTWAESPSGATGLMQLMPSTAGYVMGTLRFKEKEGQHHLTDPQINLEIGQKYVSQLLSQGGIGNDLLSLAIAYNAGPGNLRKWKRELADIDDPLLFIEMIPMAETRNYVERVLSNYWIYAMRLNQPLPSLDSVVEGKVASYIPQDDRKATIRLSAAMKPFKVADSR